VTILQSGLHWKDLRRGLHQGGAEGLPGLRSPGEHLYIREPWFGRALFLWGTIRFDRLPIKSIYIIVLHKYKMIYYLELPGDQIDFEIQIDFGLKASTGSITLTNDITSLPTPPTLYFSPFEFVL